MKASMIAVFLACIALAGPVRAETVSTGSHTYSDGERVHTTNCTTSRGDNSGILRTNCSTYSVKRVAWKDSVLGKAWQERKARKKAERRRKAEEVRQAAVRVWYEPIPSMKIRGPL